MKGKVFVTRGPSIDWFKHSTGSRNYSILFKDGHYIFGLKSLPNVFDAIFNRHPGYFRFDYEDETDLYEKATQKLHRCEVNFLDGVNFGKFFNIVSKTGGSCLSCGAKLKPEYTLLAGKGEKDKPWWPKCLICNKKFPELKTFNVYDRNDNQLAKVGYDGMWWGLWKHPRAYPKVTMFPHNLSNVRQLQVTEIEDDNN